MPFANIQEMPKLGFGLWKIPEAEAASVVYEAIKVGYRHFDSACDYGNERSVGAGIQRALNEGLCERPICGSPRNFGTPIIIQIASSKR